MISKFDNPEFFRQGVHPPVFDVNLPKGILYWKNSVRPDLDKILYQPLFSSQESPEPLAGTDGKQRQRVFHRCRLEVPVILVKKIMADTNYISSVMFTFGHISHIGSSRLRAGWGLGRLQCDDEM